MGKAWAASLKSLVDHQQSVKYKSTTIKTLRPVRSVTSSKNRWIQAYFIGLTIPGKLGSPKNNNKKKKKKSWVCQFQQWKCLGIGWKIWHFNHFILIFLSSLNQTCQETDSLIQRWAQFYVIKLLCIIYCFE